MSDLHDDFEAAEDLSGDFDKAKDYAPKRKLNDAQGDTSAKDLDRGTGQTFINRAFNGATGGLGDKILAAIAAGQNNGLVSKLFSGGMAPPEQDKASFEQRYNEALHRGDKTNAVNKSLHGTADRIGTYGGPLLTGWALPGGAATTYGRAAVNGAVTGAGLGLVGGYGSSRAPEGSLEELGDMGEGALYGAGTGAGLGVVGHYIGNRVAGLRESLKSKADSKGAELIERAMSADKAAADAPDTLVQKAATKGPDTAGSVVESEADNELASQLPSTKARIARHGGEENAARNNAEHRLQSNPEDSEAAQLMDRVNQGGRKFNPSRRSTPEYQNLGPDTQVAPRADIKGMQVEYQPRYTPQQQAKAATIAEDIKTAWGNPGVNLTAEPETLAHFDNQQPLPVINPLAKGERVGHDLGMAEKTGNIRTGTVTQGNPGAGVPSRAPTEATPVSPFQRKPNIRPDLLDRSMSPPERIEGLTPAGAKGVTGATSPQSPRALEQAPYGGPELPPEGYNDGSKLLQEALAHPANSSNPAGPLKVAGGFVKGATPSLKEAGVDYLLEHSIGHAGSVGMGVKKTMQGAQGAYETLNPAQQYGLWNGASSFGTNPMVRKYLQSVLNAGRTTAEEQAGESAPSNYTDKDPRSP